MGFEDHNNTNGNRCTWSGQERDGKIQQQNPWKHQDTKSPKLCPPRNCSYPKKEFIYQINHHILMIALSLRDELGFIGELSRISKKNKTKQQQQLLLLLVIIKII